MPNVHFSFRGGEAGRVQILLNPVFLVQLVVGNLEEAVVARNSDTALHLQSGPAQFCLVKALCGDLLICWSYRLHRLVFHHIGMRLVGNIDEGSKGLDREGLVIIRLLTILLVFLDIDEVAILGVVTAWVQQLLL